MHEVVVHYHGRIREVLKVKIDVLFEHLGRVNSV
jgi:hypothetical protein